MVSSKKGSKKPEKKLSELESKLLFTESVKRQEVSIKDRIDMCTMLYNKYGSLKAVSEQTLLPVSEVRNYVKFRSLGEALKGLVLRDKISLKIALLANDAIGEGVADGDKKEVKLALLLEKMGAKQGRHVAKIIQNNPDISFEKAVEQSKSEMKHIIKIKLVPNEYSALVEKANNSKSTVEDLVQEIIKKTLK